MKRWTSLSRELLLAKRVSLAYWYVVTDVACTGWCSAHNTPYHGTPHCTAPQHTTPHHTTLHLCTPLPLLCLQRAICRIVCGRVQCARPCRRLNSLAILICSRAMSTDGQQPPEQIPKHAEGASLCTRWRLLRQEAFGGLPQGNRCAGLHDLAQSFGAEGNLSVFAILQSRQVLRK